MSKKITIWFYLKYALRETKNRFTLKCKPVYIKPTKVLLNHSWYPQGWQEACLRTRYKMIEEAFLENRMICKV